MVNLNEIGGSTSTTDKTSKTQNIKFEGVFDIQADIPEDLAYIDSRVNEIKDIMSALQEFRKNGPIRFVTVMGPKGSGKTTLAKLIVKNSGLNMIYLNGQEIRLTRNILHHGERKRKVIPEAWNCFHNKFKDKTVLILDEADKLEDDVNFFHVISRDSRYKNLFALLISCNQITTLEDTSIWNKVVAFKHYCGGDLLHIIEKRAAVGISRYSQDILEDIAYTVDAMVKGNARMAIRTAYELLRSGPVEGNTPESRVAIKQIIIDEKKKMTMTSFKSLPERERAILKIVMINSVQTKHGNMAKSPIVLSELKKGYPEHAISESMFSRITEKLEDAGFLKKKMIREGKANFCYLEASEDIL